MDSLTLFVAGLTCSIICTASMVRREYLRCKALAEQNAATAQHIAIRADVATLHRTALECWHDDLIDVHTLNAIKAWRTHDLEVKA